MQNRWMRRLTGSIEVRLQGDYVERMLNMCRIHEIELWDIRREDASFCCHMAGADFARTLPLMKKTGTRAKVIAKSGLPFYLPFLKKRILFLIGIVLCLGLLQAATLYVWAIEYVGNTQITDDELTDFLQKEGISYGLRKTEIDCEEEEKQLRAAFPIVTWTSIYFEGTKLYVEVKENEKLAETAQETQGQDMIASEAGVIESIITRNGIPQVKAGDTVEQGQVLVSGAVPVYDEEQNIMEYQIYAADADITIRTTLELTQSIDEVYSVIAYTGRESRGFFIELLGYEIETPLIFPMERMESVRVKKQVKLLESLYLPIYYGTVERREYQLQYQNYTKEEMQEQLLAQLEKNILCLQEKGVQIIEKNVKMEKNRRGYELNASLLVVKPTGEQQKTMLEE